MTREEAIEVYNGLLNQKIKEAFEFFAPELRESEDERIRKLLVWQVHRNIEDDTNDLAGSVYDGIKGHDPDLEESIEDWKKCLSWLEKQKEQKPAEPSGKLSRQDYLYQLLIDQLITYSDYEYLIGQKPAEWSEEDEKMLVHIVELLELNSNIKNK